jgi:hypothetical protein
MIFHGTKSDNDKADHPDTHRYVGAVCGMALMVVPEFTQALHHPLDAPPNTVRLLCTSGRCFHRICHHCHLQCGAHLRNADRPRATL